MISCTLSSHNHVPNWLFSSLMMLTYFAKLLFVLHKQNAIFTPEKTHCRPAPARHMETQSTTLFSVSLRLVVTSRDINSAVNGNIPVPHPKS